MKLASRNASGTSVSRTVATAVLAAACITSPLAVFAQAAVPKAAPPAAAPTAGPAAPPPPVSAEARTAAKELIDVMNTRENLTKTFQAMSQSLPPQMAQAMNRQIEAAPTLTPEQKQKVREGMNQPFEGAVREAQGIITSPKLVDETIEKMIPIYAKYYTVPELRQLVSFYKSPIGAKTLTAMPQAINESLQAGVANFQPRINALMDKTIKTQVDALPKK